MKGPQPLFLKSGRPIIHRGSDPTLTTGVKLYETLFWIFCILEFLGGSISSTHRGLQWEKLIPMTQRHGWSIASTVSDGRKLSWK